MTLTRFYANVDQAGAAFFPNGWFFILPYLLLYLCFKYLHLPVGPLKVVFICLHLCFVLLFLVYVRRVSRKAQISELIFCLGLLLLFLIPGAYLEFPSDPWEHFRRIYAWQGYHFIDENPASSKFSYFWAWTFMSAVQPISRRIALDVYSAFWELLLAYQFYLLALRLGFSKSWARIQVLATVCFFGGNVFSFYRYYALSSTIVAYIAYLAALIVLMDVLDGKKKRAALLPFLVLIISFNHLQELMLLVISASALFLNQALERKLWRRALVYLLPPALIGSWVLGAWIVRHPQIISSRPWDPAPPFVSAWGIFRIWDPALPYLEALGIHGLFSLAMAILFFNKYRRIALLTLMPVGLMLFSPFVLIFSFMTTETYLSWRTLYAFPTSFMLVIGLKEVIGFLVVRLKARSKEELVQFSVAAIVIVVSLVPNFPYRGRLWFLLHKPATALTLQSTDLAAQWLFDNHQRGVTCIFAGDNATGAVLATNFGLTPTRRQIPYHADQLVSENGALARYLETNHICAFLVANPSLTIPAPPSRVGQLSGHWNPSIVNQNLLAGGNIDKELASLAAAGWTSTPVPPFYWIYEAPQSGVSKPSGLGLVTTNEKATTNAGTDISASEPIHEGSLELANCNVITGWVWLKTMPIFPANVDIFDRNRFLATRTADALSPPLVDARKGSGYHAFYYVPPYSLSDGRTHEIRVKLSGTDIELRNAPRQLICHSK